MYEIFEIALSGKNFILFLTVHNNYTNKSSTFAFIKVFKIPPKKQIKLPYFLIRLIKYICKLLYKHYSKIVSCKNVNKPSLSFSIFFLKTSNHSK